MKNYKNAQEHKCIRHKMGFTLIEVLVVLAILGLFVAMMTQVFTRGDDQRRFEETRIRMQEIKKAILGSPGAYVNGQRQFAGYVVDMGELPALINVDPGPGVNLQPVGLWTDQSPPLPAVLPSWAHQVISNVWMGWRGPYLEIPPRGDNILRDGWGNPVHLAISTGDITVESWGADNADDVGGEAGYDIDIEMIIKQTEYMAPVAGRVKFDGSVIDKGKIRIRMYYSFNGVETKKTIKGVPDDDGYFRFEFVQGEIDGAGRANLSIPVGLRSIIAWEESIPDVDPENDVPGTGEPQKKLIFTVEPTGNWLRDIEIQ